MAKQTPVERALATQRRKVQEMQDAHSIELEKEMQLLTDLNYARQIERELETHWRNK